VSAQFKLKFLSANPDLTAEATIKVGLATLGCKVNQYESAALAEDLQKENFLLVPFNSVADIYIINTCTVTAFSDFQARQLIRRAHRSNPQAKIMVTGCYAQIASATIAAIEGVSFVVGNDRKNIITGLLKDKATPYSRILAADIFRQKEFCNMPLARFGDRTRAFLKIQDGCNSFCSYCIVPFARGKSRSLPPQEILSALARFNQEDYHEIVLAGIHLGVYGHDLNPATDLSHLLRQVFNLAWNSRLRLSSIEPREITTDLLNIFDNNDLLCPHLHIPLQSGDDKILQLMKRNYDTLFYRDLIEKVCSTISDMAIGIDVMAGFPSESDEQFRNTLNLLEELPVAYLHVFPYSERPGTSAQNIQPKIPETVKKERTTVLRNLSTRKREKFALRFLGKPLKVLVEKTKDKKSGLLKGFSQNYLPFLLTGNISSSANKIVTVRAEKYLDGKLYGKIISR
jgi:threonylcarbamoyladenosine tRNA methylthiotransferase MtaB